MKFQEFEDIVDTLRNQEGFGQAEVSSIYTRQPELSA